MFSLVLVAAFVLAACAPTVSQPIATPPTAVPPTAVPSTAVPPTAVPPTEVPPTEVPPTAVPPTAEPVTIEWWHISTQDPGKTLWQTMADEYMAAHPNVKINITVLENEAFKTKLTTVKQGGTLPDIFQSWGGGVMNDQANAGMLLDITSYLGAIEQVRASGGGIKSSLWRQILASVLEAELLTVDVVEGAAYGAALLAGVGAGFWPNVATGCKEVIRIAETTRLDERQVEIYRSIYPIYRDLYPALKSTFQKIK